MFKSFVNPEFINDDEEGRIAALRSYQLNRDNDDSLFSDLVALAQQIGGTKMAYISLIEEEKLWFKSAIGLDMECADREITLCNEAIKHNKATVVLDALADKRFADSPVVACPPNIRFYAGAPIINPEGYAIGTICLSDPEPRKSFKNEHILVYLARQAAALLELRKNYLRQQVAAELAADQRDRLWDSSLDMMLICRPDGTIVAGNPAWESIFGPIGVDKQNLICDYFYDREAPFPINLEEGQKEVQLELEMRSKDGQRLYTSWSLAHEDGLIFGIARDMTRTRETENQLAHIQRMESIGQLTGGIAHDFNNLLTIILGNLDIAARRIANGSVSRAEAAIANAQDGAQRAASLTQRLLAFARRQSLSPSHINPARLIHDLVPLARQALDERFRLEVKCDDDIWPLTADVSQLENAILNLVVNARDAMSKAGVISITLANEMLKDKDVQQHNPEAKAGPYIRIGVTDTGTGIPPEVLEKILEPFFTTKGVGRGTGLGIPQVHGFVIQSGGFLTFDTKIGKGSTVSIWLPARPGSDDNHDQSGDTDLSCTQLEGRTGSILVVEDNDEVRSHVAEMLKECGLEVLLACDGVEARRLLKHRAMPPDILLSDIMMPRLDGHGLAQWVREHFPEMPIILMSGYDGGKMPEDSPHNVMLPKPFTPDQLIRVVVEQLKTLFAAEEDE